MKKNRIFILVLIAMLAIGMAACERTASTPPAASDTPAGEFPLPNTQQAMELLESYATQTAMAMEGSSGQPGEPEAYPGEEVETTAVPQAAKTPKPTKAPTQKPAAGSETTFDVPKTYTLQEGEFPYCLGRRFDIHPEDLLSANGLSLTSQVYPGTVLNIPQSARSFPAQRALRAHPTTYIVSGSESIYSIACLFGDVDPRAIAQENKLKDPFTISAGQTLSIP